jgi:spoIIIJ-associated protein
MTSKNLGKVIKKTTKEMLEKLGLEAKVQVIEEESGIKVLVETSQPGVLIGYHGQTLDSFQHLLKLIVNQKTAQWPSLAVDVADYRKNREKVLRSMVQSAVSQVRASNKTFVLPPLPSFERRIIHLIISGEEGVVSESEGEGRERRVVIRPERE